MLPTSPADTSESGRLPRKRQHTEHQQPHPTSLSGSAAFGPPQHASWARQKRRHHSRAAAAPFSESGACLRRSEASRMCADSVLSAVGPSAEPAVLEGGFISSVLPVGSCLRVDDTADGLLAAVDEAGQVSQALKEPSPSPSPCLLGPSANVPPAGAVVGTVTSLEPAGLQCSLEHLDAASHAVRLRTLHDEWSDKGTSVAYARHVHNYCRYWDAYQGERVAEDPSWTMVPAFLVTAAKVTMFLARKRTCEKVCFVPFCRVCVC